MTVRRDLATLQEEGHARRTHGGAVALGYARHETEFAARVKTNRKLKERIAGAAVALVRAEDAVFLDGSSTSYYIARELLERDLEITLLTNSLPILTLVSQTGAGSANLIVTGGELRRRSLSFCGPHAVRTVLAHFATLRSCR